MKKITVLGVTGSIGQQTVDVICHHRDEFELVAVSAGKNIALLEKTLSLIDTKIVCVIAKDDALYLQNKYPDLTVVYGEEGLDYIATLPEVDIVLNAIVGFAGLLPTIHAIEHKKDIEILQLKCFLIITIKNL